MIEIRIVTEEETPYKDILTQIRQNFFTDSRNKDFSFGITEQPDIENSINICTLRMNDNFYPLITYRKVGHFGKIKLSVERDSNMHIDEFVNLIQTQTLHQYAGLDDCATGKIKIITNNHSVQIIYEEGSKFVPCIYPIFKNTQWS